MPGGLFTPNPPNGTHTYEGDVSRSVPSSSDCAPLRTPPGPLSPAAVPPASSSAALPVRLSCSRLSDAGSDLRRWYLGGVGRFWGAPRALHLPVRDTHCCSRSPKSSSGVGAAPLPHCPPLSPLCRGDPLSPQGSLVPPAPGAPSAPPGASPGRRCPLPLCCNAVPIIRDEGLGLLPCRALSSTAPPYSPLRVEVPCVPKALLLPCLQICPLQCILCIPQPLEPLWCKGSPQPPLQ